MVNSIGGVSVNNPEGVEGGAKKRLIGGDVEGENIPYLLVGFFFFLFFFL